MTTASQTLSSCFESRKIINFHPESHLIVQWEVSTLQAAKLPDNVQQTLHPLLPLPPLLQLALQMQVCHRCLKLPQLEWQLLLPAYKVKCSHQRHCQHLLLAKWPLFWSRASSQLPMLPLATCMWAFLLQVWSTTCRKTTQRSLRKVGTASLIIFLVSSKLKWPSLMLCMFYSSPGGVLCSLSFARRSLLSACNLCQELELERSSSCSLLHLWRLFVAQ